MNTTPFALVVSLLGCSVLLAQSQSSSANYNLLSAPVGVSGGRVGNGSTITAEISVGDSSTGVVTTLTAGGVQEKPNYIGQLYDVEHVIVQAVPATIDEDGSRQLSATASMDDLTTLALAPTEVQWSVVLGPLTGIDGTGLATAGVVHADTPATARGTYQGVDGDLALVVLNIDADDLDSYAGDGLDDAWQVGFFGDPPNPDAAPGADPDGDSHDNRLEFLTGYDPTDSGDFFSFAMVDLTGTTATLELSKIIPGTRYRIRRSNDLGQGDPWSEFANFTTLSEIFDHQVPDPNASGTRWFYRMEVEPE